MKEEEGEEEKEEDNENLSGHEEVKTCSIYFKQVSLMLNQEMGEERLIPSLSWSLWQLSRPQQFHEVWWFSLLTIPMENGKASLDLGSFLPGHAQPLLPHAEVSAKFLADFRSHRFFSLPPKL